MRISDWSSDVCSSDLTLAMAQAAIRREVHQPLDVHRGFATKIAFDIMIGVDGFADLEHFLIGQILHAALGRDAQLLGDFLGLGRANAVDIRSEEHTSELQSLMRISYAVFCLKKKK